MKRFTIMILISVMLFGTIAAAGAAQKDEVIQMAILLDTSNSMDGLIDQAKSQLWKIVNEMATAKRNGSVPDLEVALYEYGNDSISSRKGHVRMVAPMTSDLDLISERLFSLTTNGGSEYCGTVIRDSVNDLEWKDGNDVLKVVFIAGNEEFTQGRVDYRDSCRKAIKQGIIVNTIFCGDYKEGINTSWKDGADLADGSYMNIDQDQQQVYIEAPQDKRLVELNNKLNETYIYYGGAEGEEMKERQEAQDSNARGMSYESVIQRTVTKSRKQYNNSSWDLVDKMEESDVDLGSIDDDELPPEMRKMNEKEREAYVEKKAKERQKIQKEIADLNVEREEYLTEKRKEMGEESGLDDAILTTIRKQAQDKNYKFEQ
jgi:hypothetical protein